MKKIALTTALTLALAGVAFAGAKDKNSLALVNGSSLAGSVEWDNTEIATKTKYGACKQQIQFKSKAGALEGQDIVCISSGDTYTSLALNAGNSLVMRGTMTDGKLKMKADLRAIGCGILAQTTTINSEMVCYTDSGWDGATECTGQGGLWIAPNAQAGTEKFKPADLEGLCQGFAFGFRLVPPGGTYLAEVGVYTP